ncbi:MAG: lysine 2,3-aminomutase [Gammaproteobacteria bacterium]|nr:lysine 2,3-aminomutase [Gammaproteobacteria bacterium]
MSTISALRRQHDGAAKPDAAARRFQVYTQRDLDRIEQLEQLPEQTRFDMRVVASVLPFRVNAYVIEELIDWSRVPDDPIYQLTFPQRDMLSPGQYARMAAALHAGAPKATLQALAHELRAELNPHPAGQLQLNVPTDADGQDLNGLQHKYRETVLFFPSQGQTCHSYCTFCFRWAQFVGDKALRMASTEATRLHAYLRDHREVSDLLITGGDPMVMKTKHLAGYLEALLDPAYDHVQTIRIGTKALTFWPQRFVTDDDADDLLALLSRLVRAGKHVAIMAHYNHWRELSTDIAQRAVRRLRDCGAEIRSQGPLLAHINDNADDWARLWKTQVRLGIVPYYMFVERDTGARHYFEVPLARAWNIYRDAMQQVSGLGRTARGPSMSAGPGKVEIQGVTEIGGEKLFVLRFIQGRDPDWVQRPFFARYDERATWLDQLQPAFGDAAFFFEPAYRAMQAASVDGT